MQTLECFTKKISCLPKNRIRKKEKERLTCPIIQLVTSGEREKCRRSWIKTQSVKDGKIEFFKGHSQRCSKVNRDVVYQ